MSYIPHPTQGGDFTPCPAGTYPAICYRIIDLGTHMESFGENAPAPKHKISLSWEIADDETRMPDGRPFVVSKRYTWSMHEKASLRKDLESWRGKPFVEADFGPGGFNVKNLLGVPAMLGIIHKPGKEDSVFANIASISKMPRSMVPAAQVNADVFIWLEAELFNREAFEALSDKMRDMIMTSPEWAMMKGPRQTITSGHEQLNASARLAEQKKADFYKDEELPELRG